jgi:hypothetical protein
VRRAVKSWHSGVVCLGVAVVSPAMAQDTPDAASSPLALCCQTSSVGRASIDTAPGLLRTARLVAAHDDLPDIWRRFAVQTHTASGRLRRPQTAATDRVGTLHAEGAQVAGSWRLWGQATFTRQHEADVQWRNQSAASLTSAYVWADSVGGTFRGDRLGLAAAAISPAWRGLTFALPVDYGLGQGARRNDPRPLYRRRVAEVSPSLRWRRGAHQLGLGAILGWHREDLEIGGGASTEVPVVFRLRGISTFDRTQLISAERALLGGVVGGQGGYAFRGARWQIATGGTLRVERDSVRDGIAAPVNGGQTRRVRGDVRLAARRQEVMHGIALDVVAQQETQRGRDPIFAAVNATAQGRQLQMNAEWWQGASRPVARWVAAVEARAHTFEARDVAAETRWQVTRLPVTLRGGRRWQRAAHGWIAEVGFTQHAVRGAEREVFRPTRLTPVLVNADYAVVSAPAVGGQLLLAWDRLQRGQVISRLSLSATGRRTTAPLADGRRALAAHTFTLALDVF